MKSGNNKQRSLSEIVSPLMNEQETILATQAFDFPDDAIYKYIFGNEIPEKIINQIEELKATNGVFQDRIKSCKDFVLEYEITSYEEYVRYVSGYDSGVRNFQDHLDSIEHFITLMPRELIIELVSNELENCQFNDDIYIKEGKCFVRKIMMDQKILFLLRYQNENYYNVHEESKLRKSIGTITILQSGEFQFEDKETTDLRDEIARKARLEKIRNRRNNLK